MFYQEDSHELVIGTPVREMFTCRQITILLHGKYELSLGGNVQPVPKNNEPGPIQVLIRAHDVKII